MRAPADLVQLRVDSTQLLGDLIIRDSTMQLLPLQVLVEVMMWLGRVVTLWVSLGLKRHRGVLLSQADLGSMGELNDASADL